MGVMTWIVILSIVRVTSVISLSETQPGPSQKKGNRKYPKRYRNRRSKRNSTATLGISAVPRFGRQLVRRWCNDSEFPAIALKV